jgi:hypothetical protein
MFANHVSGAVRRPALAALLAAFVVSSCGREPTARVAVNAGVTRSQPFAFLAEFPKGAAEFQAAGGSGVQFTKVHVVLNNPDGSVALDTYVDFPVGSDEVQVTLTVPMPPNTPAAGLPLSLLLDYQNASGQSVFKGGPVTVTAVPQVAGQGPPPPAQITIPIKYTGPGSQAASVRITPASQSVAMGGSFAFSAQALDASGNPVADAPIVFSIANGAIASINSANGSGKANNVRGSTTITAQTLTGQSASASLTVTPVASGLAVVSGGGQSGTVGQSLAAPVVVRVTAGDGLPMAGAAVSFSAGNGGTASPSSVTTDGSGFASASWKLGPTAGSHSLTASAGGAGSVQFTATAKPADPVRLEFVTPPPGTVKAGDAFGASVRAVDANGVVTPEFTGSISIAAGGGVGGIVGTTSATAVAGVASFSGLRITVAGSYTINAAGGGLTGTSSSMTVTPGDPTQLVFQAYPGNTTAGAGIDGVTVALKDGNGNLCTNFNGDVSLSASGPVGGSLIGASSAKASGGIASFGAMRITVAGTYAITASGGGVSATGAPFIVSPGPASILAVVGGDNQTGRPSQALFQPIVVKTSDGFGNAVGGVTVNFAVTGGGGSLSAASAVTSREAGIAQITWTMGASYGTQTMTAAAAGLSPASVRLTANVPAPPAPASAGMFIVVNDVNVFDNSNGWPYPGNVQFATNLVTFTISGPRAAANKVLLFDFQTFGIDYTFTGNWTNWAGVITGLGLTIAQTTNRADLSAIAPDVKMLILHLPTGTFSTTEVNAMKAFIAQGGRILFIGENDFFTYAINAENALLAQMGATTVGVPSCYSGFTTPGTPHPLNTGVSSWNVPCGSTITAGAGDIVLFGTPSAALAVIANVNTTPIVAAATRRSAPSAPTVAAPQLAPGWDYTVGPPPAAQKKPRP